MTMAELRAVAARLGVDVEVLVQDAQAKGVVIPGE
eukprot:CAMPEP_0202905652 /NCGR_PEP_ID=MMETSP1392-20130828/35408_1 /ASSEMBLY_ACC=CAM_ASM_000868 /TAXON_ID=225041 /ORGANISM="Chlamydomonas chlamydogama, Strain SAG 11-48b" /LENGTH=34 /DNA_ID= /DNA_START= /DNA_END= /DNA_ORIENTATION=